jgi:hypothetical protein
MTDFAPSPSGSKTLKPQPFRLPFRTLRPQPSRRDSGGRPPPGAWSSGGEEPDPEPCPAFVPTYVAGVTALGITGFQLVQPRP